MDRTLADVTRFVGRLRALMSDVSSLGGSGPIVAGLSAASLGCGVAEAAVVGLVVTAATSLAAGHRYSDLGVASFQLHHVSVLLLLALALGAVVVRAVLQIATIYLPSRIGTTAAVVLRQRTLDAYLRADWEAQSAIRQGGFVDLLATQVQLASDAVTASASMLGSALTFGALVVAAAAVSPIAFVGAIAVGGVLFGVLRPVARIGQRQATGFGVASERFGGQVETIVGMAEEVHTFGAGPSLSGQSREMGLTLARRRLGMDLAARSIWAAYQTVAMLLVVGVLLVLTAVPSLQVASVGAVVLILMRSLSGGQALQSQYQVARQQLPFLRRVQSVIDALEAAGAPDGTQSIRRVGRVELIGVSFSYRPGVLVLADVSAVIQPGELVAIVGPSGAGKSTLLQILLRLRKPDQGTLLVDGIPADSVRLSEWTDRVAYVPQDARVLHETVVANIRFYRDLSMAAVEAAARSAQIHDEIMALPDGYETVIGQRVDSLSGGQRQRLCLARALAGSPDLLVLDEPTSSLDEESERLVLDAVAGLRSRVTVLVVAHRPAILSICDRVFVVDGGVVEERFDASSRREGDR